MDSPMPMFDHDLRYTSQSPYSTEDNNGIVYCKGTYDYLDRYLYAYFPMEQKNGNLKPMALFGVLPQQ